MQNGAMGAIQIKGVPEEVHRELRRRAALQSQSLQEYLLDKLVREVQTPPVSEVLSTAAARTGGRLSLAKAARMVRADRDRK
jgi:plasmid stability protein